MKKPLKDIQKTALKLDRIEAGKAVLFTDGDEELILSKKFLPADAKEGDSLILSIATNEADKRLSEQKAKELLNELLNS